MLEKAGIVCWYAPRDVPFGVNYEEAIIDAIYGSRLVVLILSSKSNNSPHVMREIQNACAAECAKPILTVRVEDVPLDKTLRYYLSSAQWLDHSTPPLEKHLQLLVSQLSARLERPAREFSAADGKEETPPSDRSARLADGVDEVTGKVAGALAELERIKRNLDAASEGLARRRLYAYLFTLLFIGAGLTALTYAFGWDAMEPWTYFIGGVATLGTYAYFAVTQQEFSPAAIYQQLAERKRLRAYRAADFDPDEFERLTRRTGV